MLKYCFPGWSINLKIYIPIIPNNLKMYTLHGLLSSPDAIRTCVRQLIVFIFFYYLTLKYSIIISFPPFSFLPPLSPMYLFPCSLSNSWCLFPYLYTCDFKAEHLVLDNQLRGSSLEKTVSSALSTP